MGTKSDLFLEKICIKVEDEHTSPHTHKYAQNLSLKRINIVYRNYHLHLGKAGISWQGRYNPVLNTYLHMVVFKINSLEELQWWEGKKGKKRRWDSELPTH